MTESVGKVVAALAYAHAHGLDWPHLSFDSVSVLDRVDLGPKCYAWAKT